MDVTQQCPICIEDIEKDKLFKTECGHCFHIDCIYEWIENKNNKNCPLCRTDNIFPNIIRCKNNFKINHDYTINWFLMNTVLKDKDVQFIIEGIEINFPIQQLKEKVPSGWVYDYPYIDYIENNMLPIYKLYNDDGTKEVYLDFHLRQLIMWQQPIDYHKIKKHINNKEKTFYLSSTQQLNIITETGKRQITRKENTIITLWIYQVMDELRMRGIIPIYRLSINTLILDISYITIYYLGYKHAKFQLAVMCSIYNCLKLFLKKEVINISHIKDYTVNQYTDEEIQVTNKFQSIMMSKYINLIG